MDDEQKFQYLIRFFQDATKISPKNNFVSNYYVKKGFIDRYWRYSTEFHDNKN